MNYWMVGTPLFPRRQLVMGRDIGFWISPEFGYWCFEDVYYYGIHRIGACCCTNSFNVFGILIFAERRFITDYNSGNWRHVLSKERYQIPSKRGIRRRNRKCKLVNVCNRSVPECQELIAGTSLRADVSGQIMMRAYLSGTPECRFGLNDSLLFDINDALPSSGYSNSPIFGIDYKWSRSYQ